MIKPLCVATLLCAAPIVVAQCADTSNVLTPTARALLMLEKPVALTEEQWTKVIENRANREALPITIYEEETIDRCDLPLEQWYILLPGRRPPEKQPQLAPVREAP